MDSNIYLSSQNSGSPAYAPNLFNGESSEIMPPLAPSYKHSPWTAERNVYPVHNPEQGAVDRLMDSVHEGRIEDVHMRQNTLQLCIEDAHVAEGAIEIRARIVPKPATPYSNQFRTEQTYPYRASMQYPSASPYQYLNQVPSQSQYSYPYQYLNQGSSQSQYFCQYPYQNLNQIPAQPQYAYQYPYQYLNQIPAQPQYAYQYPYQYLNQIPVQYAYPYRQYLNPFPSRYSYPLANAAGGIASAISQLVLTTNLLRR